MALGIQGNARLKILFIGNSFTARNNLPGLIEQLAATRGKSFQHRLISAGDRFATGPATSGKDDTGRGAGPRRDGYPPGLTSKAAQARNRQASSSV
jgi:hypothetical protein